MTIHRNSLILSINSILTSLCLAADKVPLLRSFRGVS